MTPDPPVLALEKKCAHRRRIAIETLDHRSWTLLRVEVICCRCQIRVRLYRRRMSQSEALIRNEFHD